MMKPKNLFWLTGICLAALMATNAPSNAQNELADLIGHGVSTMDANGQLTEDFKSSLEDALKGVEIVALGEATHEDGSTYRHKAAVIEFLHRELGFNVLAFEYGFLGHWIINTKLRSGEPVYDAARYAGWASSEPAYPLYEYMGETYKTDRPLVLAGFDGEKVPDGVPNVKRFLAETTQALGVPLDRPDSLLMDSVVHAVFGPLGNPFKDPLAYHSRKRAGAMVDSLLGQWTDSELSLSERLGTERYLMGRLVLMSMQMELRSSYAGNFWNVVRDKHMAVRIKWLKELLYPGEKIILWGASAHFAHHMHSIERVSVPDDQDYPFFQTGDWLDEWYGERYYSLAFTTASGQRGMLFPEGHKYKKYGSSREVGDVVPGSFEEEAFKAGHKTLFFDLRSVDMNEPFSAYPFGHNRDVAAWRRVLDGFYFIREMEPDKRRSTE